MKRSSTRPGAGIISAGIITAALAASTGCTTTTAAREFSTDPPIRVEAVKAARQAISRCITLQGELQPFQEVEIHTKVAGYAREIRVDVGSRVASGQVLAILAVPELEHEERQATAVVERRQAEIVRAQEQLRRDESIHQSVHMAARRLIEVSNSRENLVAQQEIDDIRGKDSAAEAEIAADRAALVAAQAALEDANANVARVRAMIGYSRITSPFAGVVTKRFADTGAMLPAGTSTTNQGMPLLKLSQDDPLRLVIPVPESAVGYIRPGMPVQVRVPSLHRSFEGAVSRFSRELDSSTRTMRTEIDIPNPRFELTAGEYADVQLTLQRKDRALTLPPEAVLLRDRNPRVLVIARGNVIEQRDVHLGIESAAAVEVVSGLNDNDLVVIDTRQQLRPGQAVVPHIVPARSVGAGH